MERSLAWQSAPLKFRLKAFLGRLVVGWMWLGFVWFAARVYATSPLLDVLETLIWLGKVLAGYLIALTGWVLFNIVLNYVRPDGVGETAETVETKQDYFGRPLAVSLGSSFSDKHVVIEVSEGRKVYSTQSVAPEPLPDGKRDRKKAKHARVGASS